MKGKARARAPSEEGLELREMRALSTDDLDSPPPRYKQKIGKLSRKRSNTVEMQQKVAQDQREQVRMTIEKTISLVMRRQFFREFVPYLTLLALVIAITLIDPTDNRFHMDAATREKFLDEEFSPEDAHIRKNFKDVRSMDEFWEWVEGPLIGGLFDDTWYNDDPIARDDELYLNHASRLIGQFRLRQQRVKTRECSFDVDEPRFSSVCYPEFGGSKEAREPFGPRSNPSKYTWEEDISLEIRSTYSNVLYNGNGYVVDIALTNSTKFTNKIAELKADRWIDQATRAIFVYFNVYNANLDLFGNVMLLIEFMPSGDVGVDTSRLRFIPRMSYRVTKEIIALVLDVLVLLLLVFLMFREFQYMRIETEKPVFHISDSGTGDDMSAMLSRKKSYKKWNPAYFKTFWNYLSWVNIATFLASYIAKVLWLTKSTRIRLAYEPEYLSRSDIYFPLEVVGEVMSIADALWAINIIFTALQFFKYIRLNKQMSLVWEVVALAMPQFLVLSVTLLVVVGSFSLAYYIVYGKVIHSFRNPAIAVSTCIQMLFGDFDYQPLTFVNRYLTPLFFWIYIALSNLLLLNLFIAVISLAYETVVARKPRDDETVDYGIIDACKKNLRRMLTCNWARSKTKRARHEMTRAILITHSDSGRQLEEQAHSTDELQNEIKRVMVAKNLLTFSGPISVAEIEEALTDWIAPVDGLRPLKQTRKGERSHNHNIAKISLKDVAAGRGRMTSSADLDHLGDSEALRNLEENVMALNDNITYLHAYVDRRITAMSQEVSAMRVDFTQLMLKLDKLTSAVDGVTNAAAADSSAYRTARRSTMTRRGREPSVAISTHVTHAEDTEDAGKTSVMFGGVKYSALSQGL